MPSCGIVITSIKWYFNTNKAVKLQDVVKQSTVYAIWCLVLRVISVRVVQSPSSCLIHKTVLPFRKSAFVSLEAMLDISFLSADSPKPQSYFKLNFVTERNSHLNDCFSSYTTNQCMPHRLSLSMIAFYLYFIHGILALK